MEKLVNDFWDLSETLNKIAGNFNDEARISEDRTVKLVLTEKARSYEAAAVYLRIVLRENGCFKDAK